MDEKSTNNLGNIYTVVSGIFMGLAIADKISKTPVSEIQKLISGEALQELKQLPAKQEKQESEHDAEGKKQNDTISELKHKLAELESKSDERKSEY